MSVFLKNGAVYSIGQLFLQLISFIMLPLITHYLSTEDFGRYSIGNAVSDLFGCMMVLGIYAGYCRFYKDKNAEQKLLLRDTTFTLSLVVGSIFSLFALIVGILPSRLIFGSDNSFKILIFIVINNYFSQVGTVFLCDYYLEYKALKATILNIAKTVVFAAFCCIYLVYEKSGLLGIYKAQTISNFTLFLYFIVINIRHIHLRIDMPELKKMLRFSIGQIPGNISAIILNLSDRLFIAGYKGFNETGIYSLGYKIGMLIEPIMVIPFKQVFNTFKYEKWKSDNAQNEFKSIYIGYHLIGCLMILSASVFSRVLICLFIGNDYTEAYMIVPLIMFSYFIFGKSKFLNLGMELKNKTYLDSAVLIIGGVVNLMLNAVLVLLFGMWGAAFATLISYILINILYRKLSGPLYRIKYDSGKAAYICATAAGLCAVYFIYSLICNKTVFDIITGLALVIIYILLNRNHIKQNTGINKYISKCINKLTSKPLGCKLLGKYISKYINKLTSKLSGCKLFSGI